MRCLIFSMPAFTSSPHGTFGGLWGIWPRIHPCDRFETPAAQSPGSVPLPQEKTWSPTPQPANLPLTSRA